MKTRYCAIKLRDNEVVGIADWKHFDAAATVTAYQRQLGFEAKLPNDIAYALRQGDERRAVAWMRGKCAALLCRLREQRGTLTPSQA